METKICTQCKKELPIEDFNWREKNKGTRRSECKHCHRKHMKDSYENKKDAISKIKSQIKCQKCGECRNYTLDFHHLDPNKKEYTIAKMGTYSIERVLNEIEKCVVLCANCHREFHYLNDNYQISLDDYLNENYDKSTI